jgi:hypothetical protein
MKISRKVVTRTMFVVGFLIFGCGVELNLYFAMVRSTVPIPDSGFIYQMRNHGKVVYLTSREHWLYLGCVCGGLALVALAIWAGKAKR